jgi:hypothetical protein
VFVTPYRSVLKKHLLLCLEYQTRYHSTCTFLFWFPLADETACYFLLPDTVKVVHVVQVYSVRVDLI